MATQRHRSMRIGRVLMGLAILWGSIGLSGVRSWAQDGERERATLRGVEGVHVTVESLKPEVEQAGLTKQQLKTDVELRLRHAGIRILTIEEERRTPGKPYLYINVNVMLDPERLAVYSIQLDLIQEASLETNGSLAFVSTWSVGSLGSVGSRHLADIRNPVKDHVDQFINAYLSVNPRPAGTAAPSSAFPRRDLVRQVQERLQTVGYNPGTIDGTMGPQTQQALRWFQNAKGLRSTGDLDESTLNALGIR